MRNWFLFVGLFFSSMAFAGEEKTSIPAAINLQHFRPGEYRLSAGKESECAFGTFEVDKQTHTVNLGPFHVFFLKANAGEVKGDAPGDENCTYKFSYLGESNSAADHLKFNETRSCGKEVKHNLAKSASIQSNMIILEAEQKGNPSYKYSCVWERDTGLADAGL